MLRKLDRMRDLHHAFDPDLLRRDPWDWPGELDPVNGLDRWVLHAITRKEAHRYVSSQVPKNLLPEDVVYDPQAGTGRLFLAMLKKA